MSKTSLAVLALTLPAAQAAYSWTRGTKICAGIIVPCTDKASCSSTAIGPCPTAGTDPTAYLESQFLGLAYVNSAKYLDVATGKESAATTYKIIEATGDGFRDFKGAIEDKTKGTKFAFTMAGNSFGNTATAGGYAGIVSYLNTGTKDLSTNTVEIFGGGTGSKQVDRSKDTTTEAGKWSDSKFGAPDGPYGVCISDIDADLKCGAARTFKPDEYKFSIYGVVLGSKYDTEVVAGTGKTGEFPAGMDKMGVRMQMKATGFAVTNLKVNGKSWDKSMVNEDVTSLFIMHESGGLNIKFPKKYNTGSAAGAKVGESMTNTATHTMAIRISGVDTTAQTINVDYLFDTSKLKAGTWFIYDPDVTEAAKGSADPNAVVKAPSSGSGSAASTYTIAAATVASVAAVVGMLM